LQNYT
jgi:hypothetical protein